MTEYGQRRVRNVVIGIIPGSVCNQFTTEIKNLNKNKNLSHIGLKRITKESWQNPNKINSETFQ